MVTHWRNLKTCHVSYIGCGYHNLTYIHYKIAYDAWADASIFQALP